MSNNHLEKIRHSFSHVMAASVKELWPKTKFAIGPAVADGFYYDFDFGKHTNKTKKNEKKQRDWKVRNTTTIHYL